MRNGEAGSVGLPGEVDNSVLHLHHLHGDVLRPHSEDFKRVGQCFLGLLAAQLGTEEVALRVPVELEVVDAVEVPLAHYLLRGDLDDVHRGRDGPVLGHPRRNEGVGGRKFGGLDRLAGDGLLVQKVHRRNLEHANFVVSSPAGILVVTAPLEDRPAVRAAAVERPQLLSTIDVPNDDGVLALSFVKVARHQVVFPWRKLDLGHLTVHELAHPPEVLATPQGNTLHVKSGEKGSLWRPFDKALRPVLLLGLLALSAVHEFSPVLVGTPVRVVPEDLCVIAVADNKLVADSLVHEPGAEVGSLLDVRLFWSSELIGHLLVLRGLGHNVGHQLMALV
mmetsp:Transcript_7255/g.13528  ORF Transcript_7255/g.13528 Transcript_7255/m.13528 type:complete len:335 (-) Transcript_7255:464-1468(-)